MSPTAAPIRLRGLRTLVVPIAHNCAMQRGVVSGHRDLGPGFGSYTIVDVETSGLDSTRHRVLSVAALTLGIDGEVLDEYYTLLDPGCDPGPVHIHGLTREKLRGAPCFDNVYLQLANHLTGRVMVAHNAQHDYRFLAQEFARTGTELPVPQRLCTLAFAHRVAPPIQNNKLATLAAYYNVKQTRWHDALDDVHVLSKVLRALMADAARLGIPPPLLKCPPKDVVAYTTTSTGFHQMRTGPKSPCGYAYPGRLTNRLVQGMKFAVTGETRMERTELVARAEEAGLDGTGCVSRRTSVLVTNEPHSDSTKMHNAREFETPVVDEVLFLKLLDNVGNGIRKEDVAKTAKVSKPRAPRKQSPVPVSGPLAGRRVLVLGGSHDQAAGARLRVAELGGSTSVNLSATVTDLLVLAGGEADRRIAKARQQGVGVHGPELLASDSTSDTARDIRSSEPRRTDPITLRRGQVVDLLDIEESRSWTVRATWTQQDAWAVDIVAFLVDNDEKVGDDSDFVFYNQIEGAGARLSADGPNEQSILIDLVELPSYCSRIVIAAAIDGDGVTFGDVGAIELTATPGAEGGVGARSTLDAATEERTMLLSEIYQRGDVWRLRPIGQGYNSGLDVLARQYGVEVDDDS